MDGKCAVSDSQALSFYSVEPLYKDLYKALFKCFVSKILCNKKNNWDDSYKALYKGLTG